MTLKKDLMNLNFSCISFHLTDQCSIRCRSCLGGCSPENNSVMTFEQVTSILNNLGTEAIFHTVGFTGGESFLYPEHLIESCKYIKEKLGKEITIATNSFWATTPAVTRRILKPLANYGLNSLLVSVDDFHLEYIDPSRIINCIKISKELEIKCTIQVIRTRKSRRIPDFKNLLGLVEEDEYFTWVENNCDPVGRAAKEIPEDEFDRSSLSERGSCSMLRLLSIRLDGTAVTCCGTGSEAKGLIAGNAFSESIDDIVSRACRSPLFNSLVINGGPHEIISILERNGYPEYAQRKYTSVCDACYQIFNRPEVSEALQTIMENDWPYYLATRIAYQANLISLLRDPRSS